MYEAMLLDHINILFLTNSNHPEDFDNSAFFFTFLRLRSLRWEDHQFKVSMNYRENTRSV